MGSSVCSCGKQAGTFGIGRGTGFTTSRRVSVQIDADACNSCMPSRHVFEDVCCHVQGTQVRQCS